MAGAYVTARGERSRYFGLEQRDRAPAAAADSRGQALHTDIHDVLNAADRCEVTMLDADGDRASRSLHGFPRGLIARVRTRTISPDMPEESQVEVHSAGIAFVLDRIIEIDRGSARGGDRGLCTVGDSAPVRHREMDGPQRVAPAASGAVPRHF